MSLTPRQKQIAAFVAKGMTTKQISTVTGLTPMAVDTHIKRAAQHLDGDAFPRHKLTLWFFNLTKTDRAA